MINIHILYVGVESVGKCREGAEQRSALSTQKAYKHLHLTLPSLPALTCYGSFLEKGGGGS